MVSVLAESPRTERWAKGRTGRQTQAGRRAGTQAGRQRDGQMDRQTDLQDVSLELPEVLNTGWVTMDHHHLREREL